MHKQNTRINKFWYGAASLTLIAGCLAACAYIIPVLASYPGRIKSAYARPLQKVSIPGNAVLELDRQGAYAVYYETKAGIGDRPPPIDCRLVQMSTGDLLPLVDDFVPTNRYTTRNDRAGVLVFSTTVMEPGSYRLSCSVPVKHIDAGAMLAIGPNYYYEFLRTTWGISRSLLAGMGIACGSALISLSIIAILLFIARKERPIGIQYRNKLVGLSKGNTT